MNFTRPHPAELLGAYVRNTEIGVFGQVRYVHDIGDRIVAACQDYSGSKFEFVMFVQEFYDGIAQLVLEMPYAAWEWFDTGGQHEGRKTRPTWRALPEEDSFG